MEDKDKTKELEQQLEKALNSRPRSATLLNLKWMAEKIRKTSFLKNFVSEGKYEVKSEDVAKSLLNQK